MKRLLIFIASSLFFFPIARSQSMDNAREHIYYQRYETAKSILKNIVSKEDASPDAWYWLGEIYLEQDKKDSAHTVLISGVENFQKQGYAKKKSPLLYVGWAHLLLDSGMTADARQQMESILKETRYKDPQALLAAARANIESKNGDIPWAIELLGRARKRDKKNPAIYVALGDAYRKLVDGGNAIKNYDKALQVDAGYAEALYKKGRLYKTQNNPAVYIQQFSKAYATDNTYAPAIYELYLYYYYRDVNNAKTYLDAYIAHSDPSPEHAYMKTDLLYVSKKYKDAINQAQSIVSREGEAARPRLYKLMAYSYAGTGDSATALQHMQTYFNKQDTAAYVAKDYVLMAHLVEKLNTDKAAALPFYRKAIAMESNKKDQVEYLITVADLNNELGNRKREAVWRERIYNTKKTPTNLDLYRWGTALYAGERYNEADSVFAVYAEKYPDHVHGYLWRARSNARLDTAMEKGLAIPHYLKLIEVASADPKKNKSILLFAYGYLGSYEANVQKDYVASLAYFDKVLELSPQNKDALRYVDILKKWIAEGKNES